MVLGVPFETAVEIGKRLSRARQEIGLSYAVIANKIKIREQYLSAMEEGRWQELPPGLNGRGLVRLYARELGLAIEELENSGSSFPSEKQAAQQYQVKGKVSVSAKEHAFPPMGMTRQAVRTPRPSDREDEEAINPMTSELAGLLGLADTGRQKHKIAASPEESHVQKYATPTQEHFQKARIAESDIPVVDANSVLENMLRSSFPTAESLPPRVSTEVEPPAPVAQKTSPVIAGDRKPSLETYATQPESFRTEPEARHESSVRHETALSEEVVPEEVVRVVHVPDRAAPVAKKALHVDENHAGNAYKNVSVVHERTNPVAAFSEAGSPDELEVHSAPPSTSFQHRPQPEKPKAQSQNSTFLWAVAAFSILLIATLVVVFKKGSGSSGVSARSTEGTLEVQRSDTATNPSGAEESSLPAQGNVTPADKAEGSAPDSQVAEAPLPAGVQEVKESEQSAKALTQNPESAAGEKTEKVATPLAPGESRKAKLIVTGSVDLRIVTDGEIFFKGMQKIGEVEFSFKKDAEIYVRDGSRVRLEYEGWDHGVLGHQGRTRRLVLNARPFDAAAPGH